MSSTDDQEDVDDVVWHEGLPDSWSAIRYGAPVPSDDVDLGRPPAREVITDHAVVIREDGSQHRWISADRGAVSLGDAR